MKKYKDLFLLLALLGFLAFVLFQIKAGNELFIGFFAYKPFGICSVLEILFYFFGGTFVIITPVVLWKLFSVSMKKNSEA